MHFIKSRLSKQVFLYIFGLLAKLTILIEIIIIHGNETKIQKLTLNLMSCKNVNLNYKKDEKRCKKCEVVCKRAKLACKRVNLTRQTIFLFCSFD